MMEAENDPSDRLVDKCIDIFEQNRLRYIGPEECTKRDLEMTGHKNNDPAWAIDGSGFVKYKQKDDDPTCKVDSQLMLQFAWKRRGLAFEMANLMRFENHERIVDAIQAAMMDDPIPGFTRVSMAQALRANVMAFRLMSELTRN